MAFPELDESRGLRPSGQSGVTIVISPLLALMKDQVDALKRRGISAECIDSTKSWDELQTINQKLGKGELRLVYCAPERLNNERFVEQMKHVPGGVRFVAVDEAHCISEVIANSHAGAADIVADNGPVGPLLQARVSQRFETNITTSPPPDLGYRLLGLTIVFLQWPVSSERPRPSESSA